MPGKAFDEKETALHGHFMAEALRLAREALGRGEFPVGCVLVHNGRIVADGCREGTVFCAANELDHAEMNALRKIEPLLHQGRVNREGLVCYCTLEPCLMCYASLLIHGVTRIVYAYEDAMGGGCACDLSVLPPLYRDISPVILKNVMRMESLSLFQKFWADTNNEYLKETFLRHYTMNQPSSF